MIRSLKGRIHFAHVRNLKFNSPTDFEEAAHLSSDGTFDMLSLIHIYRFNDWRKRKMKIENYAFEGEGMQRVFENEKWTVGIKNWKPANDITGIDCLERHNKTDELFVLVEGSCTPVSYTHLFGGGCIGRWV